MSDFICLIKNITWESLEKFNYYQVLVDSQKPPTGSGIYETLQLQNIVDYLFQGQKEFDCLVSKKQCIKIFKEYLAAVANTYNPTEEWLKSNLPEFLDLGLIHKFYENIFLYACCHFLSESNYLCGMTLLSGETGSLTELSIPLKLKYYLPPYHPLEITLDEFVKISGMF